MTDLTGLVETEESSPLEPGVVELRSYARDIGLVRIVTDREGDEGERHVRGKVLEGDQRAFVREVLHDPRPRDDRDHRL